jgi:hypothetical protein
MDGKYMETKPAYNSDNSGHEDSYAIGERFQDFVCIELAKHNIIIQNINIKYFQYNEGENLQGVEIKYDGRCTGDNGTTPTGRLSIEIAEKTEASNYQFVPSGIYRNDNSWLYIQGNYMNLWIFSKNILQLLHRNGKYEEHELPTIKKFYLPIDKADLFCAKKLIFK